jgi:hypothetical protein
MFTLISAVTVACNTVLSVCLETRNIRRQSSSLRTNRSISFVFNIAVEEFAVAFSVYFERVLEFCIRDDVTTVTAT